MPSYTKQVEVGNERGYQRTSDGKEYVRHFVVGTDFDVLSGDTTDLAEMYAARAPIVPIFLEAHPGDDQAFVIEVDCKPKGGARDLFDVLVRYSTNPFDISAAEESQQVGDPSIWEPTVNWGAITTSETYSVDVDGKPVLNSAREPFVPQLTRDVTRSTIVIERNELTQPQVINAIYRDTTNDVSFAGAPPGCAKFSAATAERKRYRNIVYYAIRYEFHLRDEPWDEVDVMDAGLNELVYEFDDNGTPNNPEDDTIRIIGRKPITREHRPENGDVEHIPVTEPVPLNGQGEQLPAADVNGNPIEPVYLTFKPYRRVSWLPLQLGYLVGDVPQRPRRG